MRQAALLVLEEPPLIVVPAEGSEALQQLFGGWHGDFCILGKAEQELAGAARTSEATHPLDLVPQSQVDLIALRLYREAGFIESPSDAHDQLITVAATRPAAPPARHGFRTEHAAKKKPQRPGIQAFARYLDDAFR
jgi:hypothetical protein